MSAGRTNGIIAAAPVTAVFTVPSVIIFIIELKNVTASRTNRAVQLSVAVFFAAVDTGYIQSSFAACFVIFKE